MRRVLAAVCAMSLSACFPTAGPTESPSPSNESPSASSSASATPLSSPSPIETDARHPVESPKPAEAPTVEGAWQELDTGPMTSDEAIDVASLPDGLKSLLKTALLDEIIANEEWADEFPDCPIEAQVSALHPAGFAVGSVLGCGPGGLMGVFAERDGAWAEAVVAVDTTPECAELAQAGVPADVPYPWDGGFRCTDGADWRYW